MANRVLVHSNTASVFTASGGAAVFTADNIGNGAGRNSSQLDLGASARPQRYKLGFVYKTGGTGPAVTSAVRIYLQDGENASADLTADAAVSAETALNNFRLVGQLLTNTTATANTVYYVEFDVIVTGRYVVVAIWNATGQTNNATANTNKITLTPIDDEIQ